MTHEERITHITESFEQLTDSAQNSLLKDLVSFTRKSRAKRKAEMENEIKALSKSMDDLDDIFQFVPPMAGDPTYA